MNRFLIDADIAIYAMRDIHGVLGAIAAHGDARLSTSTLVYSQLLQGVPAAPDPARERLVIAALVELIEILPYDRDASDSYGRLIDALGFDRRNIADRMIAAHAISLDATLVTNNTRDFDGIPNLRLANWAEAA